jgi:hypothetical protein
MRMECIQIGMFSHHRKSRCFVGISRSMISSYNIIINPVATEARSGFNATCGHREEALLT